MHEDDERAAAPGRGEAAFERRRGVPPTLVGFIVLAIVSLIFIFQNSSTTKVRFLFFTVTARLWFVIAVALALGVVLDRVFSIWWRRRRQQ